MLEDPAPSSHSASLALLYYFAPLVSRRDVRADKQRMFEETQDWMKIPGSICECQFFGCNSITGVLYETLLKAIGGNRKIEGEDYSSPSNFYQDKDDSRKLTDCILDRIQEAYINTTKPFGMLNMAKSFLTNPEVVDSWKQGNPGYFPNQTAIDKLLQLEISLRPTTTSTTTLPPPTVNPASPDSPNQQNNLNGAGEFGGGGDKKSGMEKSGIIAISAAVVCVLLVVMIIFGVFFFPRRARKKDDDSDSKGEAW